MMKRKLTTLFTCFFVVAIQQLNAQNNFFAAKNESDCININQKRVIVPKKYKTFALDITAMRSFLNTLPDEAVVTNREQTPILELPLPNGTTAKFRVWESKIMEQGLANQFPDIKTYAGQGITDKYATIRFSITEFGFNAMILSSVTGSIFIDPYDQTTTTNYISYYKKDFFKETLKELPPIKIPSSKTDNVNTEAFPAGQCIGTQRRNYRLAIGCTNQYAKAATGLANPTKAQALAKIVISVNRVTAVYELEVGIHFNLVANNINIVYVTTSGDPFGPYNDLPDQLLTQSQTSITSIIGSANFDIGHTFSTGAGGLALLGVVCQDGYKASGVTGAAQPVGDAYDIDYVAHEIGHQFGGNHTFNANTGYCNGNANNSPATTATNCEPGSGTTIMAYAGICNDVGVTNDLQPHSDPQFQAISIAEILDYSILDLGNNCPTITTTGNNPPVVNAGANYTIPINTPFVLTGTATDPNNDALTYSWEQIDVNGALGDWNQTQVVKIPLFRSFVPDTSASRYFPKLDDVVNNTTTIGERLPSISRTLNFRLTVRDNHAGGAGTCFDDALITVNNTGGAFTVTYPNTTNITWLNGETRTITWNKGSTNLTPFNVANVAIELSIDGGYTFPITIVASTANDGTENIVVPANFTTTARIRVRALGNVFYNMSNFDFVIKQNPMPVKWLNITAQKEKKNIVNVLWNVNETGTNYYDVERSNTGDNFVKIGTVAAIQDAANTHNYSFIDNQPLIGKNYYRIKQVDKDGHYSYSKIVVVLIDEANRSFVVYPNPATDKVNVYCNNNNAKVTVELFDAIGRLVLQQTKTNTIQGEIFTVNLNHLPKGVYNLSVISNGDVLSKKIIVQ